MTDPLERLATPTDAPVEGAGDTLTLARVREELLAEPPPDSFRRRGWERGVFLLKLLDEARAARPTDADVEAVAEKVAVEWDRCQCAKCIGGKNDYAGCLADRLTAALAALRARREGATPTDAPVEGAADGPPINVDGAVVVSAEWLDWARARLADTPIDADRGTFVVVDDEVYNARRVRELLTRLDDPTDADVEAVLEYLRCVPCPPFCASGGRLHVDYCVQSVIQEPGFLAALRARREGA